MRVLIIANPNIGISKEKKEIIESIASRISQNGGSADITYSMKPGIGRKYSSVAAYEGYDAVYAAGGDGTVNDIASGLIGKDIPLGIIPFGTGNGLARGLKIPLEREGYTDVLFKNKTKQIDAGKISSRFFFATCGIGFDAKIAYDFNQPYNSNRKILNYFWYGIKNYFISRAEELILIADGKEIRRKVFVLTIANTSQYGGGAMVAPQANPSSGKLIAVIIPKINALKTVLLYKKLFNGTINESNDLEYIEFKSLKIKRRKFGLYHVDGETYKGDITLNVSVIPSSLKVLVP